MSHKFHFKNFEPSFKQRFQAHLTLDRVLDLAPSGAVAVGLLEKHSDQAYRCAIDIHSRQGPFMSSATGLTAEEAIEAMQNKIKRQISWWQSHQGMPAQRGHAENEISKRAVS